MRFLIMALGSRGDVIPYATLGKALRAAGHRVRVATFEGFAPLIAAHSLDFHPVRGDMQAILNSSSGHALLESRANPLRMARAIHRSIGALAESFARDLYAPALWDTEVLISQLPGGLYGCDLAEKLDIPLFAAAVMPLAPSRHYPNLAFPTRFSFIPGYNRFTHWLAYQLVWQIYRPTANRWRKRSLGLPNAPMGGYSRWMEQRPVPVLNGFSAHAAPRPPDWGAHIHVTGYWFPEEKHEQPPDDLRRFSEAGPPPVFIGFGSMTVRDPARTTGVVLEAIRRSGRRAVLHAGWAGIGQRELPAEVFRIEYAPYGWLFPRMAAVVHHGGAGTTAFGMRSGVPCIVVPFLFDQYYWGRRVAALGAGPRPIPFARLSAERLAEAIRVATTDAPMRQRAKALGEKVRAEGGVQQAVEIVHRYVA